MEKSTKIILAAIIVPCVAIGSYEAYKVTIQKPNDIKKILPKIKKRFEQDGKLANYVPAEWEIVVKKMRPSSLHKLNKILDFFINAIPNSEWQKTKKMMGDIQKSIDNSGFAALSEKNKGLPFGT